MVISYQNKLQECVRTKFHSRYMFVNPQLSMSGSTFKFVYSVIIDWDSIQAQGYMYADALCSSGALNTSRGIFSTGIPDARKSICNAYIWSYFKSVYYSHFNLSKPDKALNVQNNTRLFYGHRVLHDIISNVTSCSPDTVDNFYISMDFFPDVDVLNSLVNVDVDTKVDLQKTNPFCYSVEDIQTFSREEPGSEQFICYCKETNSIKSPKSENVLKSLQTNFPSVSDIVELDINTLSLVNNIGISPLGNMCIGSDTIYYAEDSSATTDKLSYFWGKANLISLISSPSLDSNEKIYSDFPYEEYSSMNIRHEIMSITGFDIYDSTYDNRNSGFSPTRGVNTINPDGPQGSHNPSNGDSKNNNNKRNHSRPSPKPKGDSPTLGKVKEAAVSVLKFPADVTKVLLGKDKRFTDRDVEIFNFILTAGYFMTSPKTKQISILRGAFDRALDARALRVNPAFIRGDYNSTIVLEDELIPYG